MARGGTFRFRESGPGARLIGVAIGFMLRLIVL